MKRLATLLFALGFLVSLRQASAAPTMRLSADGGVTWLLVADNGPLDSNPAVGFISYNGPVGSWVANAESGFGQPLLGSPSSPIMDVSSISTSSGAATLIVQLSDTNFVGFPNETFIGTSSGTTDGTVNYSAFRDTGNVLFGTSSTYLGDPAGVSPSPTASLLFNEGPSSGTYASSNSMVVANGTTPFSLTLQTTVIHTAAGETDTDSLLYTLPPPPACTIDGVTISATSWNKFNIPNGTSPDVWVHMHVGGLGGIPKTGVTTLQFVDVTLSLNGTSYALPDGVLVFDSSAPSTITTTFTGGQWKTLVNPNNLSDEIFFTGAAIPVTASIAAGAKATVTYNTIASVQGISFNWQWSAAVYTFWPADWNQALIQPFHGNGLHAGTPLNTTVQKSLIQGPRGGGGSNFTGSWSATGNAECQ